MLYVSINLFMNCFVFLLFSLSSSSSSSSFILRYLIGKKAIVMKDDNEGIVKNDFDNKK